MNDDELTTMVCESFTGVHTTTPVEQIASRGRAARARRRIPALAGALAVAAAAALATTSLLPGTHQASPQPTAQLAAWTVTRQADGSIRLTIRELRNPAGLQSKLRADGVPASVTLIGQQNPSCRRYPASPELLRRVISPSFEVLPAPHQGPPANTPGEALSLVVVLLIHPSALPSGIGVQLATTFTLQPPVVSNGGVEKVAHGDVEHGLVYASPRCTGSLSTPAVLVTWQKGRAQPARPFVSCQQAARAGIYTDTQVLSQPRSGRVSSPQLTTGSRTPGFNIGAPQLPGI